MTKRACSSLWDKHSRKAGSWECQLLRKNTWGQRINCIKARGGNRGQFRTEKPLPERSVDKGWNEIPLFSHIPEATTIRRGDKGGAFRELSLMKEPEKYTEAVWDKGWGRLMVSLLGCPWESPGSFLKKKKTKMPGIYLDQLNPTLEDGKLHIFSSLSRRFWLKKKKKKGLGITTIEGNSGRYGDHCLKLGWP